MNSKVQIILGKCGLNIAWKSKEFFSFRIVKLYIGPTLPISEELLKDLF